jgi:hypothetical protein
VNDNEEGLESPDNERTYEVLIELDGEPEAVIIRAPHPEEAVRRCSEQYPRALVLCVVRQ